MLDFTSQLRNASRRRIKWAGAHQGVVLTVLEDVRRLIERLSPNPVCDDCIAQRLALSVRQHANHKTRELAGQDGFERRKGECSLCGADKLTILRC